jgi:hypothetical protein
MGLQIYEWMGCITGLTCATLLALNIKASKIGWWFFLTTNAFMIVFEIEGGYNGMLLQQCGFAVTSVLGIYRSIKKPGPAQVTSKAEDKPLWFAI